MECRGNQHARFWAGMDALTDRDGGHVALAGERVHVVDVGVGLDHAGVHRPRRVPVEDTVNRRPLVGAGPSEEAADEVREDTERECEAERSVTKARRGTDGTK